MTVVNTSRFVQLATSVLTLSLCRPALAQGAQAAFVRLATLEIDAAQLESFKAAAETYRGDPSSGTGNSGFPCRCGERQTGRVRVSEVYTDANAPRAYLLTLHFHKFPAATDKMAVLASRVA